MLLACNLFLIYLIYHQGAKMTKESGASCSVFSLKNFVGYQKESVVSKEIIKKRSGTVTLFAFDAGQGLSEHTAPFDALVVVVDGTAEITISGKKFTVRSGEAIIMPANQKHALYARKAFKMALIMIRA